MSDSGGGVLSAEGYAQSKMLDNGGWNGRMPRGITPSDIDWVADNNGRIVFGDLKRADDSEELGWGAVSTGQRILHMNLLGEESKHCCVLMRHNVPTDPPRLICTVNDVTGFVAMFCYEGARHYSPFFPGNQSWQSFVDQWIGNVGKQMVGNPDAVLKKLFDRTKR